MRVLYLFDAVGVDGGLWLKYAHGLTLLGALGHLADLLRDEIVDAIQSFHGTLYQTHTLCCSCVGEGKKRLRNRRIRSCG